MNVLKQLLTGFFGWVFVAPLVSFLPRRKNLLVVIGRNGGKFVDNTKYFYLQSKSIISEQVECVWLTTSREEYNALSSKGLLVCFYPSVAGISLLLRAGILVVDSFDWYLSMRRFLLCGAKKVQLWHGAGIKRIENDAVFNQWESKVGFFSFFISRLQIFLRTFTGRSVRYDLVVSTSDFFQREFFIPSFFSRNFKVIGYPGTCLPQMNTLY